MNLFLISISGEKRIPEKTLDLIKFVKVRGLYRVFGNDLRSLDQREIKVNYKLNLAEFVVGGAISTGELGCLLSHQEIYKYMVDENISEALILEDDAELTVSLEDLLRILDLCRQSDFDLVNLHPALGGVMVQKNSNELLTSIVPSLSAFSYWINLKGARNLLSNKREPLGLADWPIQISKIRNGGTRKNIFIHSGATNSIIQETLAIHAKNRINIYYRPFTELVKFRSLYTLLQLIREVGIQVVIKSILFMRVYRRFAKLVKRRKPKDNSSVILHLFWR